jgi:hypothetical protein
MFKKIYIDNEMIIVISKSRNNNDKNVQRNASFADGKLNPQKFTKEN